MSLAEKLQPFRARYEALSMQPLQVTARLSAPIALFHALHLDAVLGTLVVARANEGNTLLEEAVIPVPIPLSALWHNKAGFALWACTDFVPLGVQARDAVYFHRRALQPAMTRANLKTDKGRHKERRTPLPTTHTSELRATCLGNAETMISLLAQASALGKKRSVLGGVLEWEIEPIEHFALIDGEGRALRTIPLAALGLADDARPPEGFCPPYWRPETAAPCLSPGEPLPPGAILPGHAR